MHGIQTGRAGETARYNLNRPEQFGYKPLNEVQGGWNKSKQALSNIMNGLEKATAGMIKIPDRAYFQARYNTSIASQLKAQGLEEPTDEIIEQAVEEARQAVFQKSGALSKGAKGVRNSINSFGGIVGFDNAGDYVLPFIETSANVTEEALDRAGLGYIKALRGMIKGNRQGLSNGEMRDLYRDLAKGIVGTGEMAAGGALLNAAKAYVKLNFGADKDYQAQEITGEKPKTLRVGNKILSVKDYDYATLLARVGEIVQGEGTNEEKINAITEAVGGTLMSAPALSALKDTVETYGKLKNEDASKIAQRAAADYVSNVAKQVLQPGVLGKVNELVDPYKRETYDPNSVLKTELNRFKNNVPGLSKTLPVKYNALGQPVKRNNIDNPVEKALSVIVTGHQNYTPNETYNYMKNYGNGIKDTDITGKRQVPLNKAKRTININGEKYKMNNKEYSQYQRLYGQFRTNLQKELINQRAYDGMDVEMTVKDFNEVRKSADAAAKYLMFGAAPKKAPKYMDEILYNTGNYLNADEI